MRVVIASEGKGGMMAGFFFFFFCKLLHYTILWANCLYVCSIGVMEKYHNAFDYLYIYIIRQASSKLYKVLQIKKGGYNFDPKIVWPSQLIQPTSQPTNQPTSQPASQPNQLTKLIRLYLSNYV